LWERDHELEGYQWISPHDSQQSVISYMRKGKKASDTLIIVINFLPVERRQYRIGVPRPGKYMPVFQSEDERYGGQGASISEPILTEKISWHDQLNSLEITLPPLSFIVLKREPVSRKSEPTAIKLGQGKKKNSKVLARKQSTSLQAERAIASNEGGNEV